MPECVRFFATFVPSRIDAEKWPEFDLELHVGIVELHVRNLLADDK